MCDKFYLKSVDMVNSTLVLPHKSLDKYKPY